MIPFPLLGLALQAAPSLISMITGSDKAEAGAKKVIDVVSTLTGIDASTADGAQRAAEAIEADPALLAQFTLQMRAVEADELKAMMKDRQDARKYSIRMAEMGGGQNWRANIMIVGAFLTLIGCVAGVFYVAQSELNALQTSMIQGPLGVIIGFVVKVLGDAFAFEFGSSRGSKQKTAQLDRMYPSQVMETPIEAVGNAFKSLR